MINSSSPLSFPETWFGIQISLFDKVVPRKLIPYLPSISLFFFSLIITNCSTSNLGVGFFFLFQFNILTSLFLVRLVIFIRLALRASERRNDPSLPLMQTFLTFSLNHNPDYDNNYK